MNMPKTSSITMMAIVLVLVTIGVRSLYFGDPILHIDEEFYLLAGERLLHGDLPYVAVWDRKPFGLFLLYAGIRSLGGHGVVQYQIVAALFAAATSAGIGVWAARSGRTIVGGLVGGLIYLAMLQRFIGYGGQAEVFMNALMLAAAAFEWRALRDGQPARALVRNGLLAMLCIGLAIQIKPTAAIPGMLFGCLLIYRGWRIGLRPPSLLAATAAWAAVALLPTALSALYYAAIGHFDAYYFANVTSIGLRAGDDGIADRIRSQIINVLAIFGLAIALTVLGWNRLAPETRREVAFLAGWLVVCAIAFIAVGGFYENYALIIGPAAAILIGRRSRPAGLGLVGIAFAVLFGAFVGVREARHLRQTREPQASYARMLATIAVNRDDSCLYVYFGYPAYYRDSGSCLPTRFAFPPHLSSFSESRALGVDPSVEIRRILANRPKLIIFAEGKSNVNHVTEDIVRRELATNYTAIARDGPHILYRRR